MFSVHPENRIQPRCVAGRRPAAGRRGAVAQHALSPQRLGLAAPATPLPPSPRKAALACGTSLAERAAVAIDYRTRVVQDDRS